MSQPAGGQPGRSFPGWALPVGASLVYLVSRLPSLMSLPIFCDEAIYLRYAQLIHRAPFANAFVSVVDPKPPLHYWLLAAIFSTTSDPLLAARLLSVGAGLLSLLLLFPLCGELRALLRETEQTDAATVATPRADALTSSACLLFLICPFLAFYQRMALAESLLVFETLLVAWLSLRWARHARTRTLRELVVGDAVPLGLAVAAALLTKQIFSYTLLGVPVAAAILRAAGNAQAAERRRLLLSFLLLLGLAFLLFAPYLLAGPRVTLRDRLLFRASHGEIEGGLAQHFRLAWDNFRYVFVPMTLTKVFPVRFEGFRAPADAGWLWLYLTPPVYLLCVGGFAALAARGELRLLAFLGTWALLMLLPFVPFATIAVSRYALPATVPFLLAGALLIQMAVRRSYAGRLVSGGSKAWRGALLVAVFLWPLRSLAIQSTRWEEQPLTRSDRWQYISGWPAGGASRKAADALAALAARRPIVVLTSALPGTPNDVLWTYLEETPNVSIYFAPWALDRPILQHPPATPDRAMLFSEFRSLSARRLLVQIPPDFLLLFVAADPYPVQEGGTISAESLLRPNNPGLSQVARFSNPPMGLPHRPDSVVIYRLR